MSLDGNGKATASAAPGEMTRASWQGAERRRTDRRDPVQRDRRDPSRAGLPYPGDRRNPATADRRWQDRRAGRAEPGATALQFGRQVGAVAGTPLDLQLVRLLQEPDLDTLLRAEPGLQHGLLARLSAVLDAGFRRAEDAALGEVHRGLYHLYGQAFVAPVGGAGRNQHHPLLAQVRREIEAAWEASLEASLERIQAFAPSEDGDFAAAFKAWCARHRLATHPFFDFIEHEATREDLVQFFLSDSAVVLRFFDLLVLSLVGADDEIRGELVDNLWDEMGKRDPAGRHTNLFRRLLNYVGVDDARIAEFGRDFHRQASWQCLAGHNLYLFLGLQRRNYFRSLGCLGSAELMDAAQYAKIVRGCRRLGWSDIEGLTYYTGHAEVDIGHGEGWLDNVMVPLVAKYPSAARELLIGTLFRLETAAQYYDHLLARLRRG